MSGFSIGFDGHHDLIACYWILKEGDC